MVTLDGILNNLISITNKLSETRQNITNDLQTLSKELPSTKRRRLQLKKERSNIRCANEVLEGDTYASEISLAASIDIEKIPDAILSGVFKKVA
uniref:Uncharacterized protein n=1 Tax=Magallana gigas TaxID=29159 RepID=A0A8W8P2P6_MAGGI